ncbi:MAG: hypothetical protein U1E29_00330 [Coriobacteriia bacterium]|nr:hypothetical protein [Coriobacteriia bacterium]
MALADIIRRIGADTEAEAGAIIVAAQTEADRGHATAERAAAERMHLELERVEHEAAEEAQTLIAAARLRGRDRIIAEKRGFLDRVLRDAIARIEALPDAEYSALLAREVAAVARGGERLEIGTLDADRLATALPAALEAAGVDTVTIAGTSPFERGVVVCGNRMTVEVSAASIAHKRRGELEAVAASTLFGKAE